MTPEREPTLSPTFKAPKPRKRRSTVKDKTLQIMQQMLESMQETQKQCKLMSENVDKKLEQMQDISTSRININNSRCTVASPATSTPSHSIVSNCSNPAFLDQDWDTLPSDTSQPIHNTPAVLPKSKKQTAIKSKRPETTRQPPPPRKHTTANTTQAAKPTPKANGRRGSPPDHSRSPREVHSKPSQKRYSI